MCFRPVPQVKTLRTPQARKNNAPKPNARPQRPPNAGKKPDAKANKKNEKPRPANVKKEDKKEDNRVRVFDIWVWSSALWNM